MTLDEARSLAKHTRITYVGGHRRDEGRMVTGKVPHVGCGGRLVHDGTDPDGDFRVVWDDAAYNDFTGRTDDESWLFCPHTLVELEVSVNVEDINDIEAFLKG